ncbi:LARGE xylosyl- and glucuronyltransferase 2 [Lamellibrachia satsuma]|nr:LARGE xylosyl- and glucuronyltransferase 2 [Lamellibrachia satsuma]
MQKKITSEKATTKTLTKTKTKQFPPMPLVDGVKLKGYGTVKDACISYYEAGRMERSVLVSVLDKDTLVDDDDITLVTQLTSSRTEKLCNLVKRWPGPISVSVYVEQTTTALLFRAKMKALLAPRKNIALHLVSEEGDFYPVNFLRNVALERIETKYVFLTDVDFEPMPRLDERLKEYISKGYLQGKNVLVVAAFEALYEKFTFPEDKADLLKMWKKKQTIRPFHFKMEKGKEVASAPHKPTFYSHWEKATRPYYAAWDDYYEPYIVMEKALMPKYWPVFVGRFYNKASHLAELFAMGFNFIVLPDVFTLHTTHQRIPDTVLEYRCGQRENVRFRIYLMHKYGLKLPIKINAL